MRLLEVQPVCVQFTGAQSLGGGRGRPVVRVCGERPFRRPWRTAAPRGQEMRSANVRGPGRRVAA